MIEWLALGLATVSLLVVIILWRSLGRVRSAAKEEREQLLGKVESLRRQLVEMHSGTIGMGQRLQAMEGLVNRLQDNQQELSLQDPERKLYSRAAKMVELGADIEELMAECELPKAEAELLISLRKGRP
ncbi:DUF2802 domain-containing protein [Aeromonas sp. RU39B]|uniref:DUF2802 domain-containing protein n=1 Tax=Aeromonas sp. RU39B TaxID=1907416 RepID=UPI0009F86284|nr:DUF2802 domain-containing protein [Aeromonas sp. RU39B]